MSSGNQPLNGKHAVVSGAGRGIGAAIAARLHAAGASLSLLGRNVESLEDAAESLTGASAKQCDVTDEARVQAVFDEIREQHGGVDVLVNNAGAAGSRPFLKLDADHLRQMFAVNVHGAVYCMQAALPGMLERGFGRIVNIASTSALKGYKYVSAYSASKHAVLGLTRCVALETADKGVTVNAVCPGFTETDIVKDTVANIMQKTGRSEDQARAELAAHNPQGRLIQPHEIAEAVAWLCLPESESITGQAIAVAGGEVM